MTPMNQQQAARPVSILLVDDHPENLLALEAILRRPDYRLVRATSGQEALRALLREEFAVILLDVMMPDMDGYEVASLIKKRESTQAIPILFLTAVARDAEHIFRGYSVGAVDFLLKPLDSAIVRSKVAVFVDLFRKAKEVERQAALLREKEVAQVRQAEARRYQLLAESIPSIVYTADPQGRVTYRNQRWAQYTGMPLAEGVGDPEYKLVHEDDRERVRQAWDGAIRRTEAFDVEFRYRRLDGQYRWFLSRAIPTSDSSGKLVEWFGTMTDIDDQKRAEAELVDSLHSRDEFFSIASHELKTPITSLKLQLQLLMRMIKKAPKEPIVASSLEERLDVLNRQSDRLDRLVDNLLDVSRIRSGKLTLERELVNVSALVREVAARFAEQAKVSGSVITLSANEDVEGHVDRVRVEQIVSNLLVNSIKYGQGRPISVSVASRDDRACIVVEDHGIGISKEDQERIFGPFERAVSARNFGGLGLGLYVIRQIVAAHDGDVRVESQLGRGAKFTIELPLEEARSAPGLETAPPGGDAGAESA